MKKFSFHSTLLALLLSPMAIFGFGAYGQPLVNFRTGAYVYEPRFERNWLSTWSVTVYGGGTKKGYQIPGVLGGPDYPDSDDSTTTDSNDANEIKTNVLDVYGWQNIQQLGANIMFNPGGTAADQLFNNALGQLLQSSPYGQGNIDFQGKFNYVEADFYFAQNFAKGFFLDFTVPVIHMEVEGLSTLPEGAIALTNTVNALPGSDSDDDTHSDDSDENQIAYIPQVSPIVAAMPAWQYVLANLGQGLVQYGYNNIGNWSRTGVGDLQLNFGWTMNNEEFDKIDFLDLTVRVGVSIPTGFKVDHEQVFSMASGYNGSVGVPLTFDAALGFCDWATIGLHLGGIFLTSKTHDHTRMKTDISQNGPIKLGYGKAKQDPGNIFDAGAFLKADHFFRGLSFEVGYLYAHQGRTNLTPDDAVTFPVAVVNTDPVLAPWHFHSINAEIDYDFAKEGRRFNPEIGVFYSQPVAGAGALRTMSGGGTLGVNVAWDF